MLYPTYLNCDSYSINSMNYSLVTKPLFATTPYYVNVDKTKSLAAEIVKRRNKYHSYACKYKNGFGNEYVFLSTEQLEAGDLCMTPDFKVVEIISEKSLDVESGYIYKFLKGKVSDFEKADEAQELINETTKEVADLEVKRKNDNAIKALDIEV